MLAQSCQGQSKSVKRVYYFFDGTLIGFLMIPCIKTLGVEPDYLLIDGRVKLSIPCRRVYISGGDSKSLSIASASIIAKVTRDRIMEDYDRVYPKYGFRQHKGYGTKQHFRAIRRHGPSPIHRFTFSPLKHL